MLKKEKQIKNILHKALLLNGEMKIALYKYELEEHISYWKDGLKKDKEDFMYAVIEHSGDVAKLLITNNDELYINEEARNKLMQLWQKNYQKNIEMFLPFMAKELAKNIISVTGVRIANEI